MAKRFKSYWKEIEQGIALALFFKNQANTDDDRRSSKHLRQALQAVPETEVWASVKQAKCNVHMATAQESLASASSGHATVQPGVNKLKLCFI